MIRPTQSDFLSKATKNSVIAVIKELPSDLITPVDAYYATNASYLLESAEKGSVVGRYSFLGVDPIIKIKIDGNECTVSENGETTVTRHRDPLRMVGDILKAHNYIGEGDLSPFPGGAVGYVGYEYIRKWEKIPKKEKDSIGVPESLFMITKYNLVFDNLMHTIKIICNIRVGNNAELDYQNALAGIEKIGNQLENSNQSNHGISDLPAAGELKSSYTKEKYMQHVDRIKKLVVDGEAIQVVLSQRMEADFDGDPFLIFRALRSINPSPYMFYLNFEEFVILGASPEIMVKVDKNNKVIVRPIAGTRPRGKTSEEDIALKEDLMADEKELAEHIMLVDLARNDLGKISKQGTIHVGRMMEVEYYSHVMHIVSEVSGILTDKMNAFDVIKATFPAGTVSGAPKVRAMEIIEDLEPVERGPYAGLIGYLSYNGTFDSCITIRSMVINNKKLYLQAGAGIVYDSVPEKEYEETLNKAKALFTAISAGGKK